MRVFKTKPFARFASREGIIDEELCEAVYQAERVLIDADLGRVPPPSPSGGLSIFTPKPKRQEIICARFQGG